MPSHSDVTFGRIVLKNKLVTIEKLWEALEENGLTLTWVPDTLGDDDD